MTIIYVNRVISTHTTRRANIIEQRPYTFFIIMYVTARGTRIIAVAAVAEGIFSIRLRNAFVYSYVYAKRY